MRAGAGLVTALAAGALLLSACGPTVGGAGAIDTPTTTATTTTSSTTSAPSTTTTTTTTTTTEPAPSPTSTATAAPSPTAAAAAYLMTGGSKGDQVRELQARLKQLEWYDGSVSGTYDTVTTAGVRGFQSKRGMPESGSVDQATWSSLAWSATEPVGTSVTIRYRYGKDAVELAAAAFITIGKEPPAIPQPVALTTPAGTNTALMQVEFVLLAGSSVAKPVIKDITTAYTCP